MTAWAEPHEYRPLRRRLVLPLVATALLFGATHLGYLKADQPNGSTDGRRHSCGYVTEDGVTDHLADYRARCGDIADGLPMARP